jgi:hypothetical protein
MLRSLLAEFVGRQAEKCCDFLGICLCNLNVNLHVAAFQLDLFSKLGVFTCSRYGMLSCKTEVNSVMSAYLCVNCGI